MSQEQYEMCSKLVDEMTIEYLRHIITNPSSVSIDDTEVHQTNDT